LGNFDDPSFPFCLWGSTERPIKEQLIGNASQNFNPWFLLHDMFSWSYAVNQIKRIQWLLIFISPWNRWEVVFSNAKNIAELKKDVFIDLKKKLRFYLNNYYDHRFWNGEGVFVIEVSEIQTQKIIWDLITQLTKYFFLLVRNHTRK